MCMDKRHSKSIYKIIITSLTLVLLLAAIPAAKADQSISVSREGRKLQLVRTTLARAMRNLAALDRRIADQKSDLALYGTLSPREAEQEISIYENSYESSVEQLALLRKKRVELATEIKKVSVYYNIGFSDLKPAKNYASSRTR